MYNLITGNPRSGTKSLAISLRRVGVDMPHEKMGNDGTVSCFFFVDSSPYPRGEYGPTHVDDGEFSDWEWNSIIHLVRHPLKCIASMRSIVGKDHQAWWRANNLAYSDKPKLLVCMEAWYFTNLYIEKMTRKRFILERPDLRSLARWLKNRKVASMEIVHSHKATGYLRPKLLGWPDLKKQDPRLAKAIFQMSEKYGY